MTGNFSGAGDRRLLARRIIIFGLVAFFLGVFQCSFFSRLKPFGAVPDIILGSLCAIIMLDNRKSGAVYAVAAGYFIDAIGAVPPSFSPLFYLIGVVCIGKISEKMMPRFVSFAVLMLPAVVLRAGFTCVNVWIASAARPSWSVIIRLALPEMICTYVFCLPIYFLIKLCMYPIHLDNG